MSQTYRVQLFGGILDGKEMILADPPQHLKVPVSTPIPAAFITSDEKLPVSSVGHDTAVYHRRGPKRGHPGTLIYTID